MNVRVVFLNGPEDGRELDLRLPADFGRLSDCAVPLPWDGLASRHHSRLGPGAKGHAVLTDLGSRNGTWLLTGEAVKDPVELRPGAFFRVGGTWFRLLAAE